MKCPCKGCVDRTVTCHGRCPRYEEFKKDKEEQNKRKYLENDAKQLSRDHEIKYRRNLKSRR